MEKRELLTKIRRLQFLDLMEKDLMEKPKKKGWMQQLQEKVLNNLQITLSNIHIRYEDNYQNLSFGLTLDTVRLESADENWNACFLTEIKNQIIRKICEMKNLSLYINREDRLKFDLNNLSSFKYAMNSAIPKDKKNLPHNYLIDPVCGTLKLMINQNENLKNDIPKLNLDFDFDKIELRFNDHQYKDIFNIIDKFYLEIKNYKVLFIEIPFFDSIFFLVSKV